MLEVRLDAQASQDYLRAFDYYWGVSPAIAAAFDAAEQSTEAMIGQFPFMGREFEGNYLIRHFAVHGFPYMLIYKIESERAIVLAVFNSRQDPRKLHDVLAPYLV